MLDPITALILKYLASAVIKFYLSSLMAAGQISYDANELGYKIPRWYMNPGRASRVFYAYGTSVDGDEFQSITAAHRHAIDQMAQHIRLGNRALIEKEIHYDTSSIKQKRLIELFVRGEGLEEFIRMNAKIDKKQLIRVDLPKPDMRAFVRLEMKVSTYVEYQTEILDALKTRLMQQKTEDILDEMEAELAAWEKEEGKLPGSTPALPPDATLDAAPALIPTPASMPHTPPPIKAPATSGGPFGQMEDELDTTD